MLSDRLVKCYHVSPMANRSSIFKKGLLTSSNKFLKYRKRLCFSIDENRIGYDFVGYMYVDVWSFYVSVDKMRLDKLADADCFMYIKENVSPEMLTLEYTII
jgi:hypothetical protein